MENVKDEFRCIDLKNNAGGIEIVGNIWNSTKHDLLEEYKSNKIENFFKNCKQFYGSWAIIDKFNKKINPCLYKHL